MRLTLPRTKLFQTADFELLFKNGKRFFSQFFIIYYLPTLLEKQPNAARLGVAVSKKSTKTNVKRNMVRRLIRERYRVRQESFQNVQLLVLGQKNLRKISRTELKADLIQAFTRVEAKIAHQNSQGQKK